MNYVSFPGRSAANGEKTCEPSSLLRIVAFLQVTLCMDDLTVARFQRRSNANSPVWYARGVERYKNGQLNVFINMNGSFRKN